MNEREPLSPELLEKYQKTRIALARIESITKLMDCELRNLDENGPKYPEEVLRIGASKKRLGENALPFLESRKHACEDKILNKFVDQEKIAILTISNLVTEQHLPRAIYENVIVNLVNRHMGNPDESEPATNSEKSSAIAKPAKSRNGEKEIIVAKGKEIALSKRTKVLLKTLKFLSETSKENLILSSALITSVYGDKIPPKDGRNRLSVALSSLRKILKIHDLAIITVIIGETNKGEILRDRTAYYLADKNESAQIDSSKKKLLTDKFNKSFEDDPSDSFTYSKIAFYLHYTSTSGALFKRIRKIAAEVLGRPLTKDSNFSKEETRKILDAYPAKRKRSIEESAENKNAVKNTGELNTESKSLLDIGRILGFKVYEKSGVVRNSKLIRETARNLGIVEADKRTPHFSPGEAERIIAELSHVETLQEKEINNKSSSSLSPAERIIESLKKNENNEKYSFTAIARALGYNYKRMSGDLIKKIREVAMEALERKIDEKRPKFTNEEAEKIIKVFLTDIKIPARKLKENTIFVGKNEPSSDNSLMSVVVPNKSGDLPEKRILGTTIIDSFNKLPDEMKKELMPVGSLLKIGEPKETLMELLSITSKERPITRRLLFNIIFRRDIDDKDYDDNLMLDTLFDSGEKEIKARGQAMVSKVMSTNSTGTVVRDSVYWLINKDNDRKSSGEGKINQVPVSKGSLAAKPVILEKDLVVPVEVLMPKKNDKAEAVTIYDGPATDQSKEVVLSERPVDMSSGLSVEQVTALGMIFRGPDFRPILEKCGVTITGGQIFQINNILSKCQEKIDQQFWSNGLFAKTTPSLMRYLRGYIDGDREVLLNKNSDYAKAILKMLPANFTGDKLDLLMNEIGKS